MIIDAYWFTRIRNYYNISNGLNANVRQIATVFPWILREQLIIRFNIYEIVMSLLNEQFRICPKSKVPLIER